MPHGAGELRLLSHQGIVLRGGLVLGVVPEQLRPAPLGEVRLPGAEVRHALRPGESRIVMNLSGGEAGAGGERGAAEHVGHFGVEAAEVHHPGAPRTGTGGQRVDAHPVPAETVFEQRAARGPEQHHALRRFAPHPEPVRQDVHPEPPGVLEGRGRRDLHRCDGELERQAGPRRVPERHRELPGVLPGLHPRRDAHLEVEHQWPLRGGWRREHGGIRAATGLVDGEERVGPETGGATALGGPGESHPLLAEDTHRDPRPPGSTERRHVGGQHLGRRRDVDLKALALASSGPDLRFPQRLERLSGPDLRQRRHRDQARRGRERGEEKDGQREHA